MTNIKYFIGLITAAGLKFFFPFPNLRYRDKIIIESETCRARGANDELAAVLYRADWWSAAFMVLKILRK